MKTHMWLSIPMLCAVLGGGSVLAVADDNKPSPPPAAPAPSASGATAEVKAGTGVDKFEITGESATFPAGTTVWIWSRITNGSGNVKHVWKQDGKEVWTATMPIGSKKWTTQSRRALPKAGEWEVDVQDDSGASLGTVKFSVQ